MHLGSTLVAIWGWGEESMSPASGSSHSPLQKSDWRYLYHKWGSYKWGGERQPASNTRLPHPEGVPEGSQPQDCHLLPPRLRKWSETLCRNRCNWRSPHHKDEPDIGCIIRKHAKRCNRVGNKQNSKIHWIKIAICNWYDI